MNYQFIAEIQDVVLKKKGVPVGSGTPLTIY
jgi:hypothetical protein